MDNIELRKYALEIAQRTTKDGVELMARANEILAFLTQDASDEANKIRLIVLVDNGNVLVCSPDARRSQSARGDRKYARKGLPTPV